MWKGSAKQDGVSPQGPAARASGKAPFPGVTPGSGDVTGQMNPRRERREDYTPKPQPRETGVKIS